jgi:8-amino-7-oxononanoate synthase
MLIGDASTTLAIGDALRARGLLVGAVRPPTVAEGSSRLRISVSSAHTDAHIDTLIAAIGDVRRSRQ